MAKSATFLFAGFLGLFGSLHGQPHVSTVGTVGFTNILLTPGYNAVSISLVNRSTFLGGVVTPSGVTGNVLTVSGALDIGPLLNASKLYYLEIMSVPPGASDCLGARFEVDVAATKTTNDDKVTLAAVSPTNTTSPVPDLSGCSFVIREHVTLSQVFGGQGNVLLHGAATSAGADQVLFYDNATSAFITYWLREDAGTVQWRSLAGSDSTDYSNLSITPGAGVFVYRQTSAGTVTIRHSGTVRTTPFRWSLPAGNSLVSHPAPMDHSPAMADMGNASGWKGSGSSTVADQIQTWNGAGFDSYWFRSNAAGSVQQWRSTNAADATDYSSSPTLLDGNSAVIIKKREPNAQHVLNLFE